jgi:hypothetical protein
MSGLYYLFPVLITILISFLVVRAAAVALMMTGLDRKRAVFQALSSFTGTGFTTREAEMVINHPTRRKIVSWLMILGNAGFVTVIVTATSSLVTSKGYTLPLDVLLLVGGIVLIYKLVSYKGFVRKFERYIENKLIKSSAFIEESPVEDLLHLIEGYGLVRAIITEDSPFVGKMLSACESCGEKLVILGIERGKTWLPVPNVKEKFEIGDRVIVYGSINELRDIFKEV